MIEVSEEEVISYVETFLDEKWEAFWEKFRLQLNEAAPASAKDPENMERLRKFIYVGYVEGFGDGGMCALDSLRKHQKKTNK